MEQIECLMLDKEEIAKMLGICKRTLESWIASGTFPKADLRQRHVLRWRKETVEQWLNEQRNL